MIYIHSYVPFTHGEKNGCAMILYNTYSRSFVATISEPEGYKDGFKTIEDAQAWAEEQVEKHFE